MKTLITKCSVAAAAFLLLTACGDDSQSQSGSSAPVTSATSTSAASTPVSQPTAQESAENLRRSIPQVVRLIAVTEDNDQNNLIGRPNGYSAATALVDSRLPKCDTPGADCGAYVEQWPDEAAAQKRADYIQSALRAAPALGQEFDTVKGGLLLRVSGELKPSQAKVYAEGFMAG